MTRNLQYELIVVLNPDLEEARKSRTVLGLNQISCP